MQNQITVSQWGDSLAIRLPQDLVASLAIEHGAELELHLEDDGFKMTLPSAPKRPALDALLAGVTPENVHKELDWGPPRGREIW